MKRKEFEELVTEFLLDELDESGFQKLKAAVHQSEEFRAFFESSMELDGALASALRPLPAVVKSNKRKINIRSLSTAAAMVLGTLVSFMVYQSFLNQDQALPVVLTENQACSFEQKGATLSLSGDGFCDFRLPSAGKLEIRLFSNSTVHWNNKGDGETNLSLEQGSILIDSKKGPGESLFLMIEKQKFQFLGTKVAASTNGKEQRVSVVEGSVEGSSTAGGNQKNRIRAGQEYLTNRKESTVRPIPKKRLAWLDGQFEARASRKAVASSSSEVFFHDKTLDGPEKSQSDSPGPEIKRNRPMVATRSAKIEVLESDQSEEAKKENQVKAEQENQELSPDPEEGSGKKPEAIRENDSPSLLWQAITYPARLVRRASAYSQKRWTKVRDKISRGTVEARREVKELENDTVEIINDIKDTFREESEPESR